MGRMTALLLALVLVAASCGGDDEVVAGGSTGDGSTTLPAGAPGGGEGGLFVSVEVGGGFVPVGHDFRSLPSAVVYEGGRTLSPGAVIEIYPGPPVLPLVEGRLDDAEVAGLLAAAADAGLLAEVPPETGEPPVADAATTTVTVVVGSATHRTSVYALTEGRSLPGLDAAQQQARERIRAFVDRVSEVVTAAEGDDWYVPERYRVLPLPERRPVDDGVEPDEREWPLADVPLVEGRCTAVAGAHAAALADALEGATEITRWRTTSGERFLLVVRPVLPHEPGCPDGT